MKEKTVGYICQGDRGALGLSAHDEKGVLWLNKLTLFSSLRAAKRAIEASRKFVTANGYDWHIDTFRVRRVTKLVKEVLTQVQIYARLVEIMGTDLQGSDLDSGVPAGPDPVRPVDSGPRVDRRSTPRGKGKLNKILDITFETLRKRSSDSEQER